MKPSLISCIVPVLNGDRFLGESLESILSQSYRPLEVIVVDDGSTDGTAEVVAAFGDRVTYWWQATAGAAAARNLGLKMAQGEFISFLDADDLWHPEKLARQVARLRQRTDIDLCLTCFQNVWMPELAEEEKRYQEHPLSRPSSAYSLCTLLARRAVFERFGNFNKDLRHGENLIWFFGAAERGAVIEILPDVLMYRRFHLNNLTRNNGLDGFFPILRAWRDYQRRPVSG